MVRIRSCKFAGVEEKQRKGTLQDPYELIFILQSNILHIPSYFKQALLLNERVIEDETLKKLLI